MRIIVGNKVLEGINEIELKLYDDGGERGIEVFSRGDLALCLVPLERGQKSKNYESRSVLKLKSILHQLMTYGYFNFSEDMCLEEK